MDTLAMLERLTDPRLPLLAEAEEIVEEIKGKLTELDAKELPDDADDIAFKAWSLIDDLSDVLTELRKELDRQS